MNETENNTIDKFLSSYLAGKRHFRNWDFDEGLSFKGMDLSHVTFESCFLYLDFRETKLINSKFIGCNMKTADFRSADLTNATIKNCLVESAMFKGAKTNNLIFEENFHYGNIINQKDFEEVVKYFDEFYTTIKLTNEFPNTTELGNILTGIIIDGNLKINDLLILNNGMEVPIVEVEFSNIVPKQHLIPEQRKFRITIPRKYNNAKNWNNLFGSELKVRNTAHNKSL